jgi:hypothetical protein
VFVSTKKLRSIESIVDELELENKKLREDALAQGHELGGEIRRLNDEILNKDQLLEQLQSELNELKNKFDHDIRNTEDESELLLLQLHQVQEELESVFLKEQDTQKQLEQIQHQQLQVANEKKSLEDSLSQANQAKIQLQQELEAVKAHQQSLQDEIARLNKDKEDLSGSLGKKQNELAQEKEQISHQLNDAQKQLELLNQQIQNKDQEIQSLKSQVEHQIKDVQQENELLLLQLHQVQEELEHYFLEHQKLQRENDTLNQRWLRLEKRAPNYLDYESISPISSDTVSETPYVEWIINNVTIAGEIYAEFRFKTLFRNGEPGISIDVNDQQGNPIEFVPRTVLRRQASLAVAQFRKLSTHQWKKIYSAAIALEQFFSQAQSANLLKGFDFAFWRQSISPMVSDIKAMPAVFRFNEIVLKRELINPDYEHLWLVFENATYGRYHWPKFEMRIGAASIQKGAFSKQPKFEFPKIDGKILPFDSWFEEAFDDYGSKLELRFDITREIFDVSVWLKLKPEDQGLITSVIGLVPLCLQQLEQAKVAISRPWTDWRDISTAAVTTLRTRLLEASQAKTETPVSNAATNPNSATNKVQPIVSTETSTKAKPAPKNSAVVKKPQGATKKASEQAKNKQNPAASNKLPIASSSKNKKTGNQPSEKMLEQDTVQIKQTSLTKQKTKTSGSAKK